MGQQSLQARFVEDFEQTLSRLASAPSFAKFTHQIQLLARTQKLLRSEAGVAVLYRHAPDFDAAGVFLGGDWLEPAQLEPALAGPALRAGGAEATMESLSELRLLAIAEGRTSSQALSVAAALDFLREVLASNLDLLFPVATEATREADSPALARARALFVFLFARLGAGAILDALITEIERVMAQRPIVVARIEILLGAAKRAIDTDPVDAETMARAAPWIAALRAPSVLSATRSTVDYPVALADLSPNELAAEAETFGHSMDRYGLVAPAHADLLCHLARFAPQHLPAALALTEDGRAALDAFAADIGRLIEAGVTRPTARAVYGLSRLLNNGPAAVRVVIPGLDRLLDLEIHPAVVDALAATSESAEWAPASTALLAGTLAILGQPRGVDQGHNPTCQAARAICLWACNDPVHLLDLIGEVAHHDDLVLDFEGQPIRASQAGAGMARTLHTELDPISLLLTPHLDRIYVEMGRRTVGRIGDGHRWVNREMHGAWVAPDFAELIDLANGAIARLDDFIRLFHASHHPAFNGGRDTTYAQPCGIAATDATGTYIGWHAVSIQRVARDPGGAWRVYFFNPNRDKGQNWGGGIETSTVGAGELEGEASLPFAQFASRLYVFHYQGDALGDPAAVDADSVARIRSLVAASWGRRFAWID